ncbi:INTS11 isoform 7 [Pan troglodytes]|uniref:Integrator complex subunit 11 n=2 Tax=Pan troglodytes TaxID=9598 RepID=A0A2J8IRP1_PANTR|nr:INTS11 isoform 7 [Pan troglodytes]
MPEIRVTPLGACPSCGRVLVLPPGRGSRAPSSTDTRTGFHVLPHGESASSEGAPCPGVDTVLQPLSCGPVILMCGAGFGHFEWLAGGGAGQDVGRSCILVSIAGKNVMLDCGMHMGFNDDRRFPDFSYITQNGRLTDFLDCVIISHFHLDHCGALPYFSEMVGYDGPIYMTHPTQAICPILLEDYRKIAVDKKGEANFFTSQMIKDCMKKVVAVHLHQTVQVDDELEIKAYYAGHVLGAAMFQIKVGSESVVYTGDYNMTPDRHLGAAWIDKCRPNLLITESTYATTIRDSKRCRERDFLKKVHETVERGGKVLIPVFALGRAQELCILLETFWERMNLKVPIYFSTGLTEKANHYYKLFIPWTNQKIRKTFVQRNMFEFKHIKAFDRAFADNPGPMVVFATPGMLHAGQSLQIFRKWAGNEKNMVRAWGGVGIWKLEADGLPFHPCCL